MIETIKNLAGCTLECFLPRIRMKHTCLLLSHMRCGSTALTHVLSSHDAIRGYGETHICYGKRFSAGRLTLRLAKRKINPLNGAYLFDKVLHNSNDRNCRPEFLTAKAIFAVRQPLNTCASIMYLKHSMDNLEPDPAWSLQYYITRLRHLRALWEKFPVENRLFIQYEKLVEAPIYHLQKISQMLGLESILCNHYDQPAVKEEGVGDPLYAHRHNSIQRLQLRPEYRAYSEQLKNCAQLEIAVALHRDLILVATEPTLALNSPKP